MPSEDQKEWSNIQLSLEKPYKNATGALLKKIYDVSNEEEFIYEQPKSIDEQLGTRLQRLFDERGNAIWDEFSPQWEEDTPDARDGSTDEAEEGDEEEDEEGTAEVKKKPMNVEELIKLRTEVIPTLHEALHELMISRDTLGVYLKTAFPTALPEGTSEDLKTLPPKAIASTTVTKPPPITSIQAFNAQLAVGGKDEALRKSAAAFKAASVSMRRALASGKRYWTDALKARNANWALVTAPLPYGVMTRRSTDNNAMDVCISYALEHGSPEHRMASMVWLNTEDGKGPIAQGARKPSRLCIFVISENSDGSKTTSRSTFLPKFIPKEDESVEDVLEDLQREAVEREIFAELVANASQLLTAPSWVREQSVSVDISANTILKFEMAYETDLEPSPLFNSDPVVNNICDAIYHALKLILLRIHVHQSSIRTKEPKPFSELKPVQAFKPPLLQGVVELFQYYLFVNKLEKHIKALSVGLEEAGIEVFLRMNRLGETAEELIEVFATSYINEDQKKRYFGGEVVLRIAQQQTLRFSLSAPANLMAHLTQSSLVIHSMSDLDELLKHEVNRCVLQRICDIGRQHTQGAAKESWFTDPVAAKCFASWDGTVIGFKVSHGESWRLKCLAELSVKGCPTSRQRFPVNDLSIFDWATGIIKEAVGA